MTTPRHLLAAIGLAMLSLSGFRLASPLESPPPSDAPSQSVAAFDQLLRARQAAEAEGLADSVRTALRIASPADSLLLASWELRLARARVAGGRAAQPGTRESVEAAIRLREREFGPDHPLVADGLVVLGRLLTALGEYQLARPVVERALAIRERHLDPDHLDLAESLEQVGSALRTARRLDEARPLLERALAIREKALGPQHPEVAGSLTILANLVRIQDPRAARPLLERALSIQEAALGPDHPDVAVALQSLGSLFFSLSDYANARPILERALAIREARLGLEHPQVATTLNTLAYVLYNSGNVEAAEPLQVRALAIREKALGPDSHSTGESLLALANTLSDRGELSKARPLYERALAIWERTQGADNPQTAMLAGTLANLLARSGEPDSAMTLYRRAVDINERALGPNHPNVGQLVYNIGTLQRVNGALGEARESYARVAAIRAHSFGPEHPEYADILWNLAYVDVVLGQYREAFDEALESERISREHFRLAVRGFSEKDALLYSAVRPKSLWVAVSAALRSEDAAMIAPAWDAVIQSRTLVLDEMARRRVGSGRPQVEARRDSLASAAAELAELIVAGGPQEGTAQRVKAARDRKERAERALAEACSPFRPDLDAQEPTLADVAAAMPPRSALVGYLLFRHLLRAPSSSAPESDADTEPRYVAFVLPADGAPPSLVTIGQAETVDGLIDRWVEECRTGALSRRRSPARSEAALRAAGEALRAVVWDPLVPFLGTADRVFLVPTSDLSLVDFAALPVEADSYLVEQDRLLHLLTTERDLIPGHASPAPRGLLAVGGASFDSPATLAALPALLADVQAPDGSISEKPTLLAAAAPAADGPEAAAGGSFRGALAPCMGLRDIQFSPLPKTAREVERLLSIWDGARRSPSVVTASHVAQGSTLALRGAEASEEAVKRLAPHYRVLHLATHGFFIGESCTTTAADNSRGVGTLTPSGGQAADAATSRGPGAQPAAPPATTTAGRYVGSPLRLSGLALAGANRRAQAGPDADDGILTAEEIAALDLGGVDWAVLSACDTGMGEVVSGGDVMGLRRAFRMAGARTVLMSLAPVKDEVALAWMEALYRARLLDGLDTAESVRSASRTLLEDRRRRGASTHPFYWAGFLATGDWR